MYGLGIERRDLSPGANRRIPPSCVSSSLEHLSICCTILAEFVVLCSNSVVLTEVWACISCSQAPSIIRAGTSQPGSPSVSHHA